MASNISVMKILSKKKKSYLFILISFFAIILTSGIKVVYAYYHDSLVYGILANKVGDFDTCDGDINLMIYKLDNFGNPVRIYSVPGSNYNFNDSLTSCIDSENASITCNDGSGNCNYTYNSLNKSFSLTSNQKITCRFYFEP